ncbi:TPA: DUF550 domain-containing protein [Klebsiella pneumoniae]|nr:DUF550 domain-containing protein [Klebsiella pneumoniae]HCQ9176643.1 DUF550 domain-containing protein [Klebsiella pneumoniae]HCQ9185557.1 DUF550 domain-containing protein [Klebsiella pneumoniae]HCQ9410808.1 DUF550 domain-containing protein [Klebsiella pneumoniae]HCQ9416388.1 DUF550 domain-containing protein [Klebsiella pneumoniae]
MTKSTITREPITHDLKIYPEFFSAVCTGVRRAELRKNDRDYRVGDTLHLTETPRGSCHQTGEFINVKITHIADVGEWMPGYVLLSVELQERRKSAMDSEPVAEVVSIYGDPEAFGEREIRPLIGIQQMPYGTKLYRHAQPASEREQVRRAHAEWSQATFGNVGPVGPLKHLSKEALEAAAEPGDLSEWADMQFLLWDAQRRAGITDDQITLAMIDKLAVNKLRSWPEPKDGEPRLHIKAQPAPIASVCTCPSGDGSLRWPCPVHAGNSLVIPDGSASMLRRWLAFGRGMQNAGCQLPHNLIAETEAMLAAAQQEVKGE